LHALQEKSRGSTNMSVRVEQRDIVYKKKKEEGGDGKNLESVLDQSRSVKNQRPYKSSEMGL